MLGVILLEKLKMENLKKKLILFVLNKSRTNKKQETKDTIITLNILIFTSFFQTYKQVGSARVHVVPGSAYLNS